MAINFNKPDQKWLEKMTLSEAKKLYAEGHFLSGSMGPKIEAIIAFLEANPHGAWRQVMGQNGGWHEGGEYVGIGIGQAIYQVPAMWRTATGEDLFKTEPGIRGFLDYMVYRKQPDGTDSRWGDAGFFDKIVSDLVTLALEYRHAAAYNVRPPRRETGPTSWPWGPLSDPSLLDPHARDTLPLARHFDGIGLVVARSDWAADATYVSFKAGDNFWSHSHLDQGAFTLYKGGGLALDSGLYGPQYGQPARGQAFSRNGGCGGRWHRLFSLTMTVSKKCQIAFAAIIAVVITGLAILIPFIRAQQALHQRVREQPPSD